MIRRFAPTVPLAALAGAWLLACGGGGPAEARDPYAGQRLGRRPFPADNAWNQRIDAAPVDPNSATLIASIGLDDRLHPDFGTVWNGAPNGIPFIVVDGDTPKVQVSFQYADESDPGPYPIPPDAPIEGGPNGAGDRHVLVVDRDNWILYELFDARPIDPGRWRAGSGAIFDLSTGAPRPAGWTSADAAGLPILPGLVRFEEVVELGAVEHALRFTARRTRRAYVPPARHWASADRSPDLPPMGLRVRLKASFRPPAAWPREARVIALALQRYGMLLADNGSDWFLSGAPDPRWNDDALHALRDVRGRDFEVVRMDGLVADD